MLEERVALELDRIRNIARETLSALQFLHVNNVVHKDLRDSSIHMTRTGVIKVSDYSIDKRLSDMYRASHSTDNKCQIVEDDFPTIQSRGGKKFDVYRLGIVLLSLFKGYIVTEQCANLDINIQVIKSVCFFFQTWKRGKITMECKPINGTQLHKNSYRSRFDTAKTQLPTRAI